MSFDYGSIEYITEEGKRILEGSAELRERIATFWEAPRPELMIGGRFVDVGRYSTVREIDGVVVKISSPTSSEDFNNAGKVIPPENLAAQFVFLHVLGEFLAAKQTNIVVPAQYFAIHSPHDGYMLVQEHMSGWVPIGDWVYDTYGPDDKEMFKAITKQIKDRIGSALAGTRLHRCLNDLRLDEDGMHGGNILVSKSASPEPNMPICIIDQPRIHRYEPNLWKNIRHLLQNC